MSCEGLVAEFNSEQWSMSHEEVCAERYRGINASIGDLRGDLKTLNKTAWGAVVALVVALVGAWSANYFRTESLQHDVATKAAAVAQVAKTSENQAEGDRARRDDQILAELHTLEHKKR